VLHNEIINKIKFEITEIEREMESYKLLFEKAKLQKPDLIEMTAIASVLHSFYNGLENIFLIISKNIDKEVPTDFNWHIKILNNMTNINAVRTNVISKELADNIEDYLAFRHFFRHSYKFKLDWEKLEDLSNNLYVIWERYKNEINIFIDNFWKNK